MLAALQLDAVATVPLKVTVLVPCVAPKLAPAIVTDVPAGPDAGFNPPMLGVVAAALVEKVISGLVALALLASVERTRKWYSVPAAKPATAAWWLVTIVVFVGVLAP
jgi:hypothetical protein